MIDEESWPMQADGEEPILLNLDSGENISLPREACLSENQHMQLRDLHNPCSNLSIDSGTSTEYTNKNDLYDSHSNLSISSVTSTQYNKENVSTRSSDTGSHSNELVPDIKKKKHFDLESYLRSTADGKYILGFFQEHKKLEDRQRALLNRLIIKSFTEDALKTVPVGHKLQNFTIPTAVFKELAKAISLLFPGELDIVYYAPYKSENGIRVPTSGGLWDHYNYTKEVLRKKNLLIRPKETKPIHEPQNVTALDVAKINWLKTNVSPWSQVCEYWAETFLIRRRKLTVENLSVTAYIDSFPCLRLQEGKELIQHDFDKLYPGKSAWLLNRWSLIKVVLIQRLQVLKIKNIDDNAYIKLLPTLASEAQDAVILYLLPLLIEAGRPGKPKKNQEAEAANIRKYSHHERREFLMLHVETSSDIPGSLERLKERALKVKLTLQPILVIVGNLMKIDQAFVQVEDQKYQVNSCLEALDLTFKAFFVFDCQYPKPSVTLWQFIQFAGFEIHLPGDRVIKSVNVLLGLIKQAFSEKE